MPRILGETQLKKLIDDVCDSQESMTPEAVRQVFSTIVDSSASRSVSMKGEQQDVNITGTNTKFVGIFDSVSVDFELDLFQTDLANERFRIRRSGVYYVTLRLEGEWDAQEDLAIHVYVNGAPHPTHPITITKAGEGVNDPTFISVTRTLFPVFSWQLVTEGVFADVELYFSSNTGAFIADYNQVSLTIDYEPFTVDQL